MTVTLIPRHCICMLIWCITYTLSYTIQLNILHIYYILHYTIYILHIYNTLYTIYTIQYYTIVGIDGAYRAAARGAVLAEVSKQQARSM